MKLHEFMTEFGDNETIISRLRVHGLLRSNVLCEACHEHMIERRVNKKDGFMFKCSKQTCRVAKSVRVGSFFENAKLTLSNSMLFLHLWSKGYTEKLIIDDFPFSGPTVVDWARFCRDLCVYHFEQSDTTIGGPTSVVEIDETMVVKRKNNRGRMLAAGWLFGGIERRNDGEFRCFLRLVYNRSAPHLTYLIRQHVAVGTHIITDGWAAYAGLPEMGYQHSVVIHEENFVDPHDPEVHTQRIESTWGSLKRFIRSRGTNKGEYYLEYICEYLFRRTFNGDVFAALLDVIRSKYPMIH